MRRTVLLALLLAAGAVPAGGAQELAYDNPLEARFWLDRGDEPVLRGGDRVRVYYRTSLDAYVGILRIATDGRVELLFPLHRGADSLVRGGRDYRLLFPRSSRWEADEYPGVGYFFMVASPEPLDFSAFHYDVTYGWDLGAVGETVYEDPYLAIDEYVARLIPDWETVPYTLDFMKYSVGETPTSPRFLRYDWPGYRPFTSWNPYGYAPTLWARAFWRGRSRAVRVRDVPSRGLTRFKEPDGARRSPTTVPSDLMARPTLRRRPSSTPTRGPTVKPRPKPRRRGGV